jgi:outer membrane protein assembly factor BamD (BamD/ComL family)
MVKLNAEKDTVTAARYHVKSYPTVLVLQKDGTEIDRVIGYYRAPEFIQEVKDRMDGRNTLAALAAAEPDSGRFPEYRSRLAERYFLHGLYDDARKNYLAFVTLDPGNTSGLSDDALLRLAIMSRKDKDYAAARRYAQQVIDRYPGSDNHKSAVLELAGNWRREGRLTKARTIYLDYAKRFPEDEDAKWAKDMADSMTVRLRRGEGV